GDPQPFWPLLWNHIEKNRLRVLQREHVLARAPIIEAAAVAWDEGGREESKRWNEARFLEVLRDI
ncbi:MAG TPA: hypothetical protein VE131_09960, partial [Terriglobales bacterium]|nr:hypothetical protein [Terriglobales bacterium]